MKKLFSLYFILSFVLISFENKTTNTHIDNDYFLIGTLSDYMGREKYKKVDSRVDRYYQSEKTLCLAVDSMLKKAYPDLKLSATKHRVTMKDEFELHSRLLADKIDEFYDYKSSGRLSINAESDTISQYNDELISKLMQSADTIYCGRLKTDIFKTDEQKLSFITGAFVRFGGYNDSTYYIKIANSVSKVKVLAKLFEEMKCDNVEYEMNGYIPNVHTVYFSPTSKMINYFDDYMYLKKRN